MLRRQKLSIFLQEKSGSQYTWGIQIDSVESTMKNDRGRLNIVFRAFTDN